MKPRDVVFLVSCIAWLVMPSTSSAQDRQGFWFGVGGGYGSAGIRCDDCDDSGREGGGVFYLKGGGTASPQVLLGGEFNFWRKEVQLDPEFKAAVNMYNFSGTVTLYPKADAGFFVKGGAGVAVIDADISGLGSGMTIDLGTGFGFIVGAGYDFPVGRRVAITPAVNYWYGQPGDLKMMGTTIISNFKQNVIDITIGITFP